MKVHMLESNGLYPQIKAPDRPARNLALAILNQAFRDIVSPNRVSQEWETWKRDAARWFSSEDVDPGSFHWVCGVLEVDSSKLRGWVDSSKLRGWIETYNTSGLRGRKEVARKLIRFRIYSD